jgi:hypothetical protein
LVLIFGVGPENHPSLKIKIKIPILEISLIFKIKKKSSWVVFSVGEFHRILNHQFSRVVFINQGFLFFIFIFLLFLGLIFVSLLIIIVMMN